MKSINHKRQSNIELLRIIAMFMVLVLHANFLALNPPTSNDLFSRPIPTITRIFIEALSVVCVNVFVLISGYFSIRPNIQGCCKFIFQCIFFLFPIGLISHICFGTQLKYDFLFMNQDCYWFVKAYIGLLIIAPVINSFIEKVTQKQLLTWIIFFYLFQTLYGGFISKGADFFLKGYSTLSFIGLYTLGRYVRLYPSKYTNQSMIKSFSIYLIITMIMTLFSILGLKYISNVGISSKVLNQCVACYVNPFTVIASLYLLLSFTKLHFSSRIINYIAASSFAVYLLHTNPALLGIYTEKMKLLYDTFNGIYYLFIISGTLIAIFITAIIIDQIRLYFWNLINKTYTNLLRLI